MTLLFLLAYIILISIISAWVTVSDKHRAIRRRRRIPERTLLILSILGGSVAMLVTMLAIRHKTRHVKFMLGIPLIILIQLILLYAVINKINL